MDQIVRKQSSSIQRRQVSASAPNVHTGSDPAGDRSHILSARVSLDKQIEAATASSRLNFADNKENKVTFVAPAVTANLSCMTKLLVGSGHILNDLCASLWYSYLLLYFQNIVGFKSEYAAMLLLLGQIADGVATPLIGYAEDSVRNCWLCRKNFGRFKSWHIIGSGLVMLTFPFIFTECLGCSEKADWVKIIYYSPFIVVFQVGWAITQISHLALIPKVHPDENIRTELLAIRYGFTVFANVTIFTTTSLILGFQADCKISKLDAEKFRNIALIAVCIGAIFTLIFHVFVKEESDEDVIRKSSGVSKLLTQQSYIQSRLAFPTTFNPNLTEGNELPQILAEKTTVQELSRIETNDQNKKEIKDVQLPAVLVPSKIENFELNSGESVDNTIKHRKVMTVKDWLKTGQFYNVAAIYTFTRLTVNLTQCYMPLYLQDTLKLPCSTVATVPLTMFLSGLIVSICVKQVNAKLGRMFSYLLGVLLSVTGSLCILYLDWSHGGFLHKICIYIVAAILGGGASALLVTSLAITADLIGTNIESGAFVYGSMSFCDKICCGLVIMLINTLEPYCQNQNPLCTNLPSFYRHVVGYSCGVFSIAGFFTVSLRSYFIKLGKNRK